MMTEWLSKLAGVRPEEGRRTLWATVFYFFFVAHVVMVKSAANALFLSRHEPTNLPYLYILVALIVAVFVLLASKSLADPRRRRLRIISGGLTIGVYLACWLLLRLDLLPVSPFVYLFAEVAATALNIQFWSVAGDLFDPQEGKRVFGILAGGGMGGSIAGGVLVRELSPHIGAVNLIGAAALSLLASLVMQLVIGIQPGRTENNREERSLVAALKYVSTTPYARAFGGLMLLGMVLTSFIDYFFRISAQKLLGENQLAVLFGELNTWVGVISVTFLFLFSGRILRRIGIFYYLFLTPLCMALTCLVSMVAPAFAVIYALKIIENASSMSINPAALQLMFNPIPAALRAGARGIIDGLYRKAGYAVGGLLLIALADHFAPPAWQIIILSMLALFLLLLIRLRTLYLRLLSEHLRLREDGPSKLRLEDANSHRALLESLHSKDTGLICTALELLADAPSIDLEQPLQGLIHHPVERVRVAAIRAVAKRGYQTFLFDLLAITNSSNKTLQAEALRAIVALDPIRASAALVPYLKSEDPGLAAAAIEHYLKLQGFSENNPAVETLERWLAQGANAPLEQRRELCKLLGGLGQSPYSLHLLPLLHDVDVVVRCEAALACGQIRRMEFVPRLLNMLSDREVRTQARLALATYGDRVTDMLEEWLNDLTKPLVLRIRLPRLIRMIGTQRAGEVLLFSNIQDHAILRYRIALALSGIRTSPDVKFDRKWAIEAVDRRLESYRHYAAVMRRIALHLSPRSLVVRALRDRLTQNIEVAFRLLGLIFPHRTLMAIHHRCQNPSSRESFEDALELLDNVIDRETRDRLIPILERHHHLMALRPEIPEDIRLEPVRPDLIELSRSRDVLMSAAAIHTRVQLGDDCAAEFPLLFEGISTMEIMEKVLFLESVDIFRQNNLDDLTALAAIARGERFGPEEHILTEGHPGEALYIITRGEVDILKGNRRILRLGPRSSLGGVSLLDQKPHAASAVAVTDCDALVIERTDFMDLVSDRVELLHGIFLALTDRLRALLAVTEGGGLSDAEYDDGPTNPV